MSLCSILGTISDARIVSDRPKPICQMVLMVIILFLKVVIKKIEQFWIPTLVKFNEDLALFKG